MRHAMLCQEPWCFTPDQIAQLTALQVEELYLKPAQMRAESMKEKEWKKTGGPVIPLDDEESFIRGMDAQFPGQPREKWASDYKRMMEARNGQSEPEPGTGS